MFRRVLLLTLLIVILADQRVLVEQHNEKVQIEVFYETLCASCHRYLVNTLGLTVQTPGIEDIVEFKLVPFGNVKVEQTNHGTTFVCQHGEQECLGNKLHACALHLYAFRPAFNYILCLQRSSKVWDQAGQKCAEIHNLDWPLINNCWTSEEGDQLMTINRDRTRQARVRSVPRVLINGVYDHRVPVHGDQLLDTICRNYNGHHVIQACEERDI